MILDPRGGPAGELVQRAAPPPGSGEGAKPSRAAIKAATQCIERARQDWGRTPKAVSALNRDRSLRSRDRRMASDLAWHVVRGRRLLELLLGHTDGSCSSVDLVRGAAVLYADAPRDLLPAEIRGNFDDPRHALLGHVLTHDIAPAAALGLATSLPDWFAAQLLDTYPTDEAVSLAQSLMGRAPLTLRAHRDRITRLDLLHELSEMRVACASSAVAPDAVELTARTNLNNLPPVERGDASAQDAGSQRIAALVDPQAGETILDACAGAGGKTFAMASLAPSARIVGCDVRKPALEQAGRRARAYGISDRLRFVLIPPAGALPKAVAQQVDAVLIDAPCTGSGSLRREPHARWSRSPLEVEKLPPLQGAILDRFAPFVKPGGRLIYATCSLFQSENDAVVTDFVGRNPSFQLSEEEPLRLRPDRDGCDGFFAVVLLRRADAPGSAPDGA